jgi:hypothetical protein
MRARMTTILEPVIIRGIEGFIADGYLLKIAQGDMTFGLLDNYQEAKNIAIQVYFQWRKLGLR